jgi:aldehyde:ferredoxin oxidoreductase
MPMSDGVPKVLRIDLTRGTSLLEPAQEIFDEWMGGTGVGTYLFSTELDKANNPDPLAPEAPIIFTIGALASMFPMITKSVVTFRSPLTGGSGSLTRAGGWQRAAA